MSFFFLLFLLYPVLAQNNEVNFLLEAKHSLEYPNSALADWNPNDSTPCKWKGITCSSGSVSVINFNQIGITGSFPPSLCNLKNLNTLILPLNNLNGSLLSKSIEGCKSLTYLDLSLNLFVGALPDGLAYLPELTYLDLMGNNFTGAIPPSFGKFTNLQYISLVNNLLHSTVPEFFSNVTTLRQLNLSYNPFTAGPVPESFSRLTALDTLWLAGCNLIGTIPESLSELKNLSNLDLSINGLTGSIPASLTTLPLIEQIELFNNSLTGTIPEGFARMPTLRRIDASMNKLHGPIPDFFVNPLLDSVHLYQNQLTGPLPDSAAMAANLVELRLFQNKLNGTIPTDLGKNSNLMFVDLSDNDFSGQIPDGICDRGQLTELLLIDNGLDGSIPDSLARCRTLRRVRLANNNLKGTVPAGLWGLPHISILDLSDNLLSGNISPVISGAANLSNLLISGNAFNGSIPSEIGALSKLYEFDGSNNRLTGPLPSSLGNLQDLGQLILRNNSLSGELLHGIQLWVKLTELNLAFNDITGSIPSELGSLPVLNYLDLAGNVLTGEIPKELQNLKLNVFNLSNNQLTGPIPPLYASSAFRDSFTGNPGLCEGLNGLCPSSDGNSAHRGGFVWLLRAVFMLGAAMFVVGAGWFYCKYKNFKKPKLGMDKSKWILTSFHKLGFSEYEIMDCLDEDNVIGSGASGKVYKAVLSNGEAVAVKKLWGSTKNNDEQQKSTLEEDAFESEVTTLGKIRHKNIVKLWCCCSHKDCKLLVYEYMPNGSLGDFLHSSKSGLLDWPTRYKIAVDAAEGLSYLHHDCLPPIVHRDVKSNNILLDGDFGARVADFGVAKAVDMIGKGPKSMSGIAGSCGYIAPEYAYTLRVNEKSDIYSFGVVILELVTGRLPVDPEFGEKDLVKWVCSMLELKGLDHVLDPKLDSCFREEICGVLNIGLLCTSSLPINRPSMRRVVKMLLEVGATEEKLKQEKKDGKFSPYYYEDASDHGSIV